MGDCFIVRRGGGGENLKTAFALISVTYPAGSTVTCSNTTTGKTYTAGNTYGVWLFGVNSAGTWRVTSTNGTKSSSKDVSITTQNQTEMITLMYGLYLFDATQGGLVNADVSGGFIARGSNSLILTDSAVGFKTDSAGSDNEEITNRVVTNNAIDLTPYSTLEANITATQYTTALYAGTSRDSSTVASASRNNAGVLTLNVSQLNGLFYVGISNTYRRYGVYNHDVTADLIKLS